MLIPMRVHNVTAEYIAEIERAYPAARNMSNGDFVSFRVHGVTPQWLGALTAEGYRNITPSR